MNLMRSFTVTGMHLRAAGLPAAALAAGVSLIAAAGLAVPALHAAIDQKVTILRTPNGGIEPQAAVDERGKLHLIYFKGDPNGGDLYYVRREAGKEAFSAPIRVNSHAGSAVATGSVRGVHLAIGRSGRIHVSWMGSKTAEPKGPGGATPMLYTRTNDTNNGFEPERNVMQFAAGLDGGGSIAADRSGNVYVTWHAGDERQGEAKRQVWVARSTDDGRTFSRETPAFAKPTGACGCCSMRAFTDNRENLYLLYRSATQLVHRDMYLLCSTDHGRDFSGQMLQPWKINACPMTTSSISQEGDRVLVAWETAGQVYYSEVAPGTSKFSTPIAAPGTSGKRKYPAVAGNQKGETILAWTEGTGWKKGGSLAWQVFDAKGTPVGEPGNAPGVPVWGLPSVVSLPGGGFTIFY